MTRGRIAIVCAVAGLTTAAGPLVFQAIEEIVYSNNCKPPDVPYLPEWCRAPPIACHIGDLSILIGPWLVATYPPRTTGGDRPELR